MNRRGGKPIPEIRNVLVYLKDVAFSGVPPATRTQIWQTNEAFTPRVVAITRGSTIDSAVPQDDGRGFRMVVNVEGEYAFGYTRISGEVTRTQFEAAASTAIASAWFLQAVHTLSPRWFVAARQEGVSAPPLRTALTVGPRRMYHMSEATVGYRLSREFTLRGSFMSRKAYTRTAWDQQIGASVVWTRRWW